MSYQVLARKWRPKQLSQLLGQPHVVRALTHSLTEQRLHHAYLFTGTRGVGKTTVARLLAKCLCCEQGISATPCGQCSACTAIDTGSFIDVLEVDAASRTKVEDTRELLDNVQYASTQGRFKIYLIDEVHMLSTHSFNALLKTLEEPPAHVKFLFATTDVKKVPETVLSRCIQFGLKCIPVAVIVDHLSEVLTAEQITFEVPALQLLAQAAAGSLRDALSLTDQAIMLGTGKVTAADVQWMLGTVSYDQVQRLLQAVMHQDSPLVLQLVAELAEQGVAWSQVLQELMVLVHQLAMHNAFPFIADSATSSKTALTQAMEQEAAQLDADCLQVWYQILLLGRRDWQYYPDPRMALEMILLRMLLLRPMPIAAKSPTPVVSRGTQNAMAEVVEVQLAQDDVVAQDVADLDLPVVPEAMLTQTKATLSNEVVSPNNQDNVNITENKTVTQDLQAQPLDQQWAQIVAQLGLDGGALNLARNTALTKLTEQQLQLVIYHKQQALVRQQWLQQITQALAQLGYQQQVTIDLSKQEVHNTPQQLAQQARVVQQNLAHQAIMDDPKVIRLQQQFDATVRSESVRPVRNNKEE